MKKYTATYFRYNPQLSAGGYKTTRTIEARNKTEATRKATKLASATIYGSMALLTVEQADKQ